MPDAHSFEYAIVRVVPRVERGEFVNVGVVLYCRAVDVLAARTELDAARVRALDPDADLGVIEAHLASLARICEGGPGAGPIGRLSTAERFRWLVAPRSTMLQFSPVHEGLCDDAHAALDTAMRRFVQPAPGRSPELPSRGTR